MRADWIRLMIAAARLPLRSDAAKSQLERPRTKRRDYLVVGIDYSEQQLTTQESIWCVAMCIFCTLLI